MEEVSEHGRGVPEPNLQCRVTRVQPLKSHGLALFSADVARTAHRWNCAPVVCRRATGSPLKATPVVCNVCSGHFTRSTTTVVKAVEGATKAVGVT